MYDRCDSEWWFIGLMVIDLGYQSKRPPISMSSSSAAGGGGGASFLASGFLPALSSFFSTTGAAVEAAGADPAAGALATAPPKLKKLEMSFPFKALANNLGQ